MTESISAQEAFYAEYDWFIGHVKSLAMSPEACSEDQGNYNVAHELWYFISRADQMIHDPIKVMSEEQQAAVEVLIRTVEAIPEEARGWTTAAQESVENMRHGAWAAARVQAQKLLVTLTSIAKLRDRYYA